MAIYTVQTRNGMKSVDSPYTLQEVLLILGSLCGFVTTALKIVGSNACKLASSNFACDLYRKSQRGLSQAQIAWVHILVHDALTPVQPKQGLAGYGAIVSMFSTAAAKLKWPAFKLQTSSGEMLRLCLNKAKGHINLTDGREFGSNLYYGKIDTATGEFHPSRNAMSAEVTNLLQALQSDPKQTVAAYGHATGQCCFCSKSLHGNGDRSVKVGYGEKCASNYGLPWGLD